MTTKFDQLCSLLAQAPGAVILQTHDVPDPDAIAAAFGLQYLLAQRSIASRIVYNSRIEKSDTRAMLELFGIQLTELGNRAGSGQTDSISDNDWAVLVDSQKNSGNVLDLPSLEVAVIDHHSRRNDVQWQFADIRPEVGSCSTMIAGYFFENKIEPPPNIATALLYGIFIDTDYLLRGVSKTDTEAFCKLHPLADQNKLRTLRSSQLTLQDLTLYANGFSKVQVYDNVGFLELGPANDSLIGSANDLLLSVQEVEVALCYSLRETDVKFSIRSSNPRVQANELAKFICNGYGFGGGHSHMAGGCLSRAKLPALRPAGLFIQHRCISFLEQVQSGSAAE
ncbi:MAG: DHH family phosphoesterase [Spirochaetes bacterium]|nr:DHH family phosphoesterase [Spirochaetota bacterium]MBU0954737.1 DHH family phosphoesterase [Spirochaetota bacterium]